MLSYSDVDGSTLRAAGDIIEALRAAQRIQLTLAEEELHTVCYFGRAVAAAIAGIAVDSPQMMPYSFTYGESGGPFSAAVYQAIRALESQSLIESRAEGAGPSGRMYSLAPGAESAASEIDALGDPMKGGEYIRTTVASAALRPFPLVMNAIYSEPSLAEARAQRLRTGVPLNTVILTDWVRGLMGALEAAAVENRGADTIIPVLIDLLVAHDE